MTQRTTGLYSALSAPQVHRLVQRAVRIRGHERAILDYLEAKPGDRVLDIGCGTGDVAKALSDVEYVGFDLNERCITYARSHHGARGSFFVGDVTDVGPEALGQFDRVIVHGVLHHLDDEGVLRLSALAASVLNPAGRMVTVDGCHDPSQSRLARYVVDRDRGQSIRTIDEYTALVGQHFESTTPHLHHDLYRIPYTLVILEATQPRHGVSDAAEAATQPGSAGADGS